MKTRKDYGNKISSPLKPGSIIIAQPFWSNEIARHAVIYIVDHNDNGTWGIIINKASNIHVYELMNSTRIKIDKRIYYGGSESLDIISYLHNIPDIPEADYLGNGIYYGGNPLSVEELISDGRIDFDKIKFFAGSIEWEYGKLESEIVDNKWWVSEIYARELFYSAPENLWTRKLLLNGNMYGMFSEEFDPSLN